MDVDLTVQKEDRYAFDSPLGSDTSSPGMVTNAVSAFQTAGGQQSQQHNSFQSNSNQSTLITQLFGTEFSLAHISIPPRFQWEVPASRNEGR